VIDRAAQREAHALLYRVIEDFDKTLAEFNVLTKSAFPERHSRQPQVTIEGLLTGEYENEFEQ
jgi:hypothetical protein